MPSIDSLAFLSSHPIDKIVDEGEITIVNDGDTGNNMQQSRIVTGSTPHNYSRVGLIRARWSIDGGSNWQSLDSILVYTFTWSTTSSHPAHPLTMTLHGHDSSISIGATTSNINFRTANGRHGNVTSPAIGVNNYTPTPRTFRIQWWMYERE